MDHLAKAQCSEKGSNTRFEIEIFNKLKSKGLKFKTHYSKVKGVILNRGRV